MPSNQTESSLDRIFVESRARFYTLIKRKYPLTDILNIHFSCRKKCSFFEKLIYNNTFNEYLP
ncbi:hypothetical protein [Helicobacter labetoulli]|uniref:hypothetical protein n=1 Tax=Helicobacter labetoulli TaxID=2315333 RepID=UPI001300533B